MDTEKIVSICMECVARELITLGQKPTKTQIDNLRKSISEKLNQEAK